MNRATLAGVLPALLALCACQPQDPDGATAPPPADAPPIGSTADYSRPITALGTEPFWSVRIDGTQLTLTRPDGPELVTTAPGAAISPGRASWTARSADGQTLSVTLKASVCSDGMSDRSYPMTAEAALGAEILRGCAIPTADLRPE